MKTRLKIAAVILCFAAVACKQEPGKAHAGNNGKNAPRSSEHTVSLPLDTALTAISQYGDICVFLNNALRASLVKDTGRIHIQAFTIRHEDLLLALGISEENLEIIRPMLNFKSVRAYLGNYKDSLHLFLTPVYEGRDSITVDREGHCRVFDLTAPCPNTCDPKSKLYTAYGL